jgi:hypothetical protein
VVVVSIEEKERQRRKRKRKRKTEERQLIFLFSSLHSYSTHPQEPHQEEGQGRVTIRNPLLGWCLSADVLRKKRVTWIGKDAQWTSGQNIAGYLVVCASFF